MIVNVHLTTSKFAFFFSLWVFAFEKMHYVFIFYAHLYLWSDHMMCARAHAHARENVVILLPIVFAFSFVWFTCKNAHGARAMGHLFICLFVCFLCRLSHGCSQSFNSIMRQYVHVALFVCCLSNAYNGLCLMFVHRLGSIRTANHSFIWNVILFLFYVYLLDIFICQIKIAEFGTSKSLHGHWNVCDDHTTNRIAHVCTIHIGALYNYLNKHNKTNAYLFASFIAISNDVHACQFLFLFIIFHLFWMALYCVTVQQLALVIAISTSVNNGCSEKQWIESVFFWGIAVFKETKPR